MMRFWVRFAALSSVLTATLAGCGGFGVYESEFSCPNSYNGRCVSVSSAYELAHKGQDGPEYDPAVQKEKGAKSPEEREKRRTNSLQPVARKPRMFPTKSRCSSGLTDCCVNRLLLL